MGTVVIEWEQEKKKFFSLLKWCAHFLKSRTKDTHLSKNMDKTQGIYFSLSYKKMMKATICEKTFEQPTLVSLTF